MLLAHCIRRAAPRAAWMAGKRRETSTPIMAITTSSSTSVNAGLARMAKPRETQSRANVHDVESNGSANENAARQDRDARGGELADESRRAARSVGKFGRLRS